MKRDLLVIYRILEKVEESEFDSSSNPTPIPIVVKGVSSEVIQYHLMLLSDAGYIKIIRSKKGLIAPTRLTWKGHDYLDNASDIVIEGIENVFAEIHPV